MPIEKRVLLGGLDSDTTDELVAQGDYRYALNIRSGSSDGNNIGSVENLKGNTKIKVVLPVGDNAVIGTYDDKLGSNVYFFVFNQSAIKGISNMHSIYELNYASENPVLTLIMSDPVLGFKKENLITGINKIEGSLFWTDNTPEPKMIDVELAKNGTKANTVYSMVTVSEVFGGNTRIDFGNTHSLVVGDSVRISQTSPVVKSAINGIHSIIDVPTSLSIVIDVKFGDAVEVVYDWGSEFVYSYSQEGVATLNILSYPSPLLLEHVTQIRKPPSCDPEVKYGSDSSKNINLLNGKLFQFKYRFIYYNYQKSSWSPISTLAFPAANCEGEDDASVDNNIEVIVETGTKLVSRIEIAAREGNISDFFSIAEIVKDRDNIESNTTTTYKFYNDKVYNNLEINESIKLFDRVPRLAQSQEFVEGGRMAWGDVTEDFDLPTIDASLSVDYISSPENVEEKTYTISGDLRIVDPFTKDDDYYLRNQPIWTQNGGEDIFWGGFGMMLGAPKVSTGADYHQTLNKGIKGFVFYLAGTSYSGVSVQRGGVYNAKTKTDLESINTSVKGDNVYSSFSITGVPNGVYILRVASHLIAEIDKDLAYQKTSTNTVFVGGIAGQSVSSGGSSCIANYNECIVTINGSDIKIGQTRICSLAGQPDVLRVSLTSVTGVVIDSQTLDAPRINGCRVSFSYDSNNLNSLKSTYPMDQWASGWTYTDHNGYYFYGHLVGVGRTLSVVNISLDNEVFPTTTTPSSADYGKLTNSTTRQINGNTNNRRTVLTGVVKKGGDGIKGVNVVTSGASSVTTDINGEYGVVVYSPGYTNNLKGSIIFSGDVGGDCAYVASNPVIDFNITIDKDHYTYTNQYTVIDNIYTPSTLSKTSRALKRGWQGQFGIVYYDNFNRSSSVITRDSLKLSIPFYTETPGLALGMPSVSWAISSRPPVWATHYQWVRTRNTFLDKYIQFSAWDISFVSGDGDTTFELANQIAIDINNISVNYKKENPSSILVYDFSEGDRIRFIKDNDSNFFETYQDFKILSLDKKGRVRIDKSEALREITSGTLFEIYTPKLKADSEIFYECSECLSVGSAGTAQAYHDAPTFTRVLAGQGKGDDNESNQSFHPQDLSSVSADGRSARGLFETGDAYYRERSIPVKNTSVNAGTSLVKYQNALIDDASYSDFFVSNYSDIGRPNIIDNDFKETVRPSTIYYSEQFIPETKINRLNSVYDTNFETYDQKYGSIQKLYTQDEYLQVFQELKTGAVPVNRNVMVDNGTTNVVGISSKVLNQIRYYAGEYGIGRHPESFAVYGTVKYFVDINRGDVLRLSLDGLTPISDYKMNNYFNNKSLAIKQAGGKVNILGVYDVKFGEYIVCFPDEAVSFSERDNRWKSFYSYIPEMIGVIGINIVSFKNGTAYTHNTNNVYNNFYNAQYNSVVGIVFNQDPSQVKVFKAVSEEATAKWVIPEITTPSGQLSDLIEGDFVTKENIHYANILMDKNTPDVQDPIINGHVMRNRTILLKLTNNSTIFTKLFGVNVNYSLSERSNK